MLRSIYYALYTSEKKRKSVNKNLKKHNLCLFCPIFCDIMKNNEKSV
jgi:hypothetical protein